MEPGSLTLQADSLLPEPPGKLIYRNLINFYWYSILLLFYNFLLLFTEFLICSSFYSFLNWQLRPLILYLSVQFSHSVVSDSLWPHELQHTRPPCPSPTPGVHSNSRSSSRWCHPAISSSVVPFSSCPQSLPASESCPMSQIFAWGSQSTGVSTLASLLPKNTQDWSPLLFPNISCTISSKYCSTAFYKL